VRASIYARLRRFKKILGKIYCSRISSDICDYQNKKKAETGVFLSCLIETAGEPLFFTDI
jgi:hypothetical protein